MSLLKHLITESQHFINEISSRKQEILLKKILHLFITDTVALSIMEEVIDLLNFPLDDLTMYKYDKDAESALGKYHYNKLNGLIVEYDNTYTLEIIIKNIKFLDDFFKAFVVDVDPTDNLKYGNWIIDRVLNFFIEEPIKGRLPDNINDYLNLRNIKTLKQDKEKLREYLTLYHEAKRKNKLPNEYRDINQLPDKMNIQSVNTWGYQETSNPIKILYNIVKDFKTEQEGSVFDLIDSKLSKRKDYEVISEGSYDYNVYVPLNQKSASIMGHNTEWCTTYGKHCTVDDYKSRSSAYDNYNSLVILINRKDSSDKKQFAFYENEFMDQDDVAVDMRQFWYGNPELMRDIMEFDNIHDGEYRILDGIEEWLATQGEEFLGDVITSGMGDTFDDIFNMLNWNAPSSGDNTDDILNVMNIDKSEANKHKRDYFNVIYESHHEPPLIEYNNIEVIFDIFNIDFNEEVDTIDEVLKTWLRTSIKYEYEYNGMYRLELDTEYTQAWICDYMLDTNIFPKVY